MVLQYCLSSTRRGAFGSRSVCRYSWCRTYAAAVMEFKNKSAAALLGVTFYEKILLVLLAVFLLITSGCKQQTVTPLENPSSAYVVTDDKGRQVKISGKPMRIVSATYGTDEILAEVVDPGRIKAFSKWAGDPEITFITQEQADQVGNKVGENTEAIVALKPDLVFVSVATSDSLVKNLEDMGIPVYVAGSPKTVAAMRKKVLGVAVAAGENARGEALVAAMDQKLLELESKLQTIPKDKEKS